MNPKLQYRCPECDELHDDWDDAIDCCRPIIGQTWVCGTCGSENSDYDDAEACCQPTDPDSPVTLQVNQAELEAAGQLRLLP